MELEKLDAEQLSELLPQRVPTRDLFVPMLKRHVEEKCDIRDTPDKTSSVHFLRFELSGAMCEAVKAGADINAGIAHAHYSHTLCPIPRFIRDSLANDLD